MKKAHDSIPYVCLYQEYLEVLAPFTYEEIGRLVTAMLRYSQFGEVPEFTGNERYIWPTLKSKIDMDKEAYQLKCEKNRRNGKKGGRPEKNPAVISETDGFSEEPKKANQNNNQNQNQNQNQSQNQNQNQNQSESQKENQKPAAALAAGFGPLFLPPTVEEVRSFCKQQGYGLDPGRFVDYYTANGWQMGTAPMKDWKAALKCWNGKERTNGKSKLEPTWHVGTEL